MQIHVMVIYYNSTRVFNNLTTVLAVARVTFHRYYESYFNGYNNAQV